MPRKLSELYNQVLELSETHRPSEIADMLGINRHRVHSFLKTKRKKDIREGASPKSASDMGYIPTLRVGMEHWEMLSPEVRERFLKHRG